MEDAHARDVAEVLAAFQVDAGRGLDDSAVLRSRQLHGRNEIPPEKGTPFWKLVIKQFDDLLVKILVAAAVVRVSFDSLPGTAGTIHSFRIQTLRALRMNLEKNSRSDFG